MRGERERASPGHARRARVAMCALASLASLGLASRTHAQTISNSETRAVFIEPERQLHLKAPETLYAHHVAGSPHVAVVRGERTIDVYAHAAFQPPMVAVLLVTGDTHEWTVILKAAAGPELVLDEIALVVEQTVPVEAPERPKPAPPSRERILPAGTLSFGIHAMAGHAVTALKLPDVDQFSSQLSLALGLRVSAAPVDAPWRIELGINARRLIAPLWYFPLEGGRRQDVNVAWHQAILQARTRIPGTRFISAFIGLGAQMRTLEVLEASASEWTQPPTEWGLLGTIGIGISQRIGAVDLDYDLAIQSGYPDGYLALGFMLSVGIDGLTRGG